VFTIGSEDFVSPLFLVYETFSQKLPFSLLYFFSEAEIVLLCGLP